MSPLRFCVNPSNPPSIAPGGPALPGPGPLALLGHHTDSAREWAYDRNSPIGALDKTLDEAGKRAWTST